VAERHDECEGCGLRPEGGGLEREPCPDCGGHRLCPDCAEEIRRVGLGRDGGTFCDAVDGWRLEIALAGAERSCFVCGAPGRAPEWACQPCGGTHRVCRACMRANPMVTAGECAVEARARRTGRLEQ